MRLVVVYRPPHTKNCTMSQFFDEFADFLDSLSSHRGHILITGDLNFHFDDISDEKANELKSLLTSFNLQQHVQQSTHRNGHTLDLVISRIDDPCVTSVNAEDHGFPDHFPVFINTNLAKPPAPKKSISYRRIKTINPETLRDAISQSSLVTTNFDDFPLDHQVNLYHHELSAILDELAPLKTRTIACRTNAEWFNEEIRKAKQERRQAERKWRKTGLLVDRQMYMEQRGNVNTLIEAAKKDHYKNLVVNCQDNRHLFQILNKLLGRVHNTQLPFEKSSFELAEMFSHFFIKKIEDIRNSIPHADDPTPLNTPLSCSFDQFTPASVPQVMKLIASCPAKSCPLDPFPTELITANKEELTPAITSIINRSLVEGIFPSMYKCALIKPLLKKSTLDPLLPKNYRPVSNLCFVSKLVEKVVASQLNDYLLSNNLQEQHQSAYRCSHNTETALLHVLDDIVHSVGSHQIVLFVALDLSAAFDTVDYTLLEEMLAGLGVQGTAAAWFRSYLRDRKQQVIVQDATSESQHLECGVPQGSVLGPLLFTLYTASLGRVLRHHAVHYHFYADDAQLWLPFTPGNMNDAIDTMQRCLHDVQKWMSHHKLKMNCSKTEFIVIASKHHARTLDLQQPINIGGDTIFPSASPIRNLGVLLDPFISMEKYVTQVCKTCYFYIHNFNRIKGFLDFETLERLVHCFISSRLDYCNSLFLGLPASQTNQLQRVQNAAARVLTGTSRFEHISPVLFQLHWLPLEARVNFKVLTLMHKCFYRNGPSYLCDLIHRELHDRLLRSADQCLMCVPFTQSSLVFNRSFSVAGPRMWNTLPYELRCIADIDVFKKRLKTLLFRDSYHEFI